MRIGALLLLAGCQNLFGLRTVPGPDGHAIDAHDAAAMGSDAAAIPDGLRIIDGTPSGTALVQQAVGQNTGTGLDVTLPSNPTPGNILVVVGGATCGLDTTTPLTGGGVTFWTPAAASEVSPTDAIFFGVTNGAQKTVHLNSKCASTSSVPTWALVTEWTGLQNAPADDNVSQGMMGASSSGNIDLAVNPPNAPDLIVFGVACYGTIGSPTVNGWTELMPVTAASSVHQRVWYELAPTPGPWEMVVPYNNEFDAAMVALRAQ